MRRRDFLAGLAVAALWPGVAFAGLPTSKRLVVLQLRGGLDGLAALVPHGDPDYAAARGALALPGPDEVDGVLDLDGSFGLHPALAPLKPLWDAGELGFVNAVGTPWPGRSHFDDQDVLENGTDRPQGAATGWLGRALAALGTPPDAVAIGQALPLVLRGSSATSVDPLAKERGGGEFLDQVAALYERDTQLGPALSEAIVAQTRLDSELAAMPKAKSAGKVLSPRLVQAVGILLAAEAGPRVAVIDVGGWDTHQAQGTTSGALAQRLGGLGEGIAGLKAALGAAWADTVVVAVSEFGRTVHVNGTGGTDHGTGGLVWLAGGAVHGGIHGTWPGLGKSALFEGRDLAATSDVRAVLAGITQGQLGVASRDLTTTVFPGVVPMEGLVRSG